MNALKTGILMILIFALFIFVGDLIGGKEGMTIAFVIALAMNGFSYWFSDKIVLAMYRAREVTPEQAPHLHEIVRDLAEKAHLPMPKVYIIDSPSPNAFATGRGPKHATVAVTSGIVRLLDDNELSGVIGHELSHVANRDILTMSIVATVAGAIMFLANMARWAAIFGGMGGRSRDDRQGNGLALLFVAIFAPLAAMLIQMWISRTREYDADHDGARLAGNPLWLASALRKLERGVASYPIDAGASTSHLFIVKPFSGRSLLTLFSTHPAVADRVAKLEEQARKMGID